jgi:hypothetical protein
MKRLPMILLLFLSACTSSRITSFRDPDFPRMQFSKLIVLSNLRYEYIEEFENQLTQAFKDYHVQPIYFWRLFPPFKTYDSLYVENAIRKSGANAFLVVSFFDIADTVFVPGTSSTMDFGGMRLLGNRTTWSNSSFTTSNPAHQWVAYTRKITSEIYTIQDKEKIWVSYFSSESRDSQMLFYSYSGRIVSALQRDSIIVQ